MIPIFFIKSHVAKSDVCIFFQVILSQSQDKALRRIGELREVKQNPFLFSEFLNSWINRVATYINRKGG